MSDLPSLPLRFRHQCRRAHLTGVAVVVIRDFPRRRKTGLRIWADLPPFTLRPKDLCKDWQYQTMDDEGVGDAEIPTCAYLEERPEPKE